MKKKRKIIVYITAIAFIFMILILKENIFANNENKVYNISSTIQGK